MRDKAQGSHDDPDKHPRMEFMIDRSDPANLRVIDVTRAQILPDGRLSIVTTPVDPSDQESWVAIGVKGPRSNPKVSLTKSDLTKLLELAFADGVGCDQRYDGGVDNQLSCVTDILEDVFDELPADDGEEDYSPSSEPVATLQVEPSGPHFAGVDAMTGEVIFSDSGKPPKCTISIVRENGLLETMDIDPVYVRQSGYIQEMTPTELEHVRQPPGFDIYDMPGDFKPIPSANPEIDYDQLGGWLYENHLIRWRLHV